MNVILKIKTDRVDAATGIPLVRIVIERIAVRLADDARAVFDGTPMLVPVPGSSLTKPHTVWPSRRVCDRSRIAVPRGARPTTSGGSHLSSA
jgi:hypothetical protein